MDISTCMASHTQYRTVITIKTRHKQAIYPPAACSRGQQGSSLCVPAAVSAQRLCSQHASLQLAGHNLTLLLQLSGQTLKLQLLRRHAMFKPRSQASRSG